MQDIPLVAIIGNIGAGKSEASLALEREFNFTRMSFALELRVSCVKLIIGGVWPPETPKDILESFADCSLSQPPALRALAIDQAALEIHMKPTTPRARRLLQWYGTDYCRAKDPACWAKLAMIRLDDLIKHSEAMGRLSKESVSGVVFDDLRFPEELEALTQRGARIWRIEGRGDISRTHKSESHWPAFEYHRLIYNRKVGDPEWERVELSRKVRNLYRGDFEGWWYCDHCTNAIEGRLHFPGSRCPMCGAKEKG